MTEEEINISPSEMSIIKKILHQQIPSYKVWAFGSRVKGTAKKFSDLDLVIKTTTPLPLNILGDLAEAFSESDLSIKVDILDWSRISEEFQKVILEKYIVLIN